MTYALDLAKRNDGYLVSARDPAIVELIAAGLITVTDVGDGYLIARAVHVQTAYHVRYTAARRWEKRANRELAAVIGQAAGMSPHNQQQRDLRQ